MLDKDATVRCKAVALAIKLIQKTSASQHMDAMAQDTTTLSLLQDVTSRCASQCSRTIHMPMGKFLSCQLLTSLGYLCFSASGLACLQDYIGNVHRLQDTSINVRKKAFMLSQVFEDAASTSHHTQTLMDAASELLPTLCKMLQALPTSPLGAADHQKVGRRLLREALQASLLMLVLASMMAGSCCAYSA